MLTTPVSNQSFGMTKYNLADYNRYRSASTPVNYYNDYSNKSSIENLANIFLSGTADENKPDSEIKTSKTPKRKSKFILFNWLDRTSEVIAKTYNVLVGQKFDKYRDLTDKIL